MRERPAVLILAIATLLLFSAAGAGHLGTAPTPTRSSSGTETGRPGVDHPALTARPGVSSFENDAWQSFPLPAGFPDVRGFSVASDLFDRSVLLFGGCPTGSCATGSNETWKESNGVWSELHPSVSPPARFDAMMTWDPIDGYVLLFGGSAATALNDTWAFKNGSWNPVLPSGPSPTPTDQGALAYDPSDRAVVLYGGSSCVSACPTWTYSGGAWTDLGPITGPPEEYGAAFAEDDVDRGALLYGGFDGSGNSVFGTWLFSHDAWSQVTGATDTAPRVGTPFEAWDPSLDAVVLGGDAQFWVYAGGNWTAWAGSTGPNGNVSEGAWDPTTGVLLEVSGCAGAMCPSVSLWGFGPQYTVAVSSIGAPCATFTVGGVSVVSGGTVPLENGTYPLLVNSCRGFLLGNVSAGPPLVLTVSTQTATEWNGSVVLGGAGSISASFAPVASNPPPTGLDAITVFGLTFLELLLVVVAIGAGVVALLVLSRHPDRPPKPSRFSRSRRPPGF